MATNTHIPVRSARRCILRPAVTKFIFATAVAIATSSALALSGAITAGPGIAQATGPRSAQAVSGQGYGYPVKPFDREHLMRANFGDPRMQFHGPPTITRSCTGTAASRSTRASTSPLPAAPPSTPSSTGPYARLAGVDPRDFGRQPRLRVLAHRPARPERRAGHRSADAARPRHRISNHVHLTEYEGGRVVNPLVPGRLTPYHDSTRPVVRTIGFRRSDSGSDVLPIFLRGSVEIVASAETPRLQRLTHVVRTDDARLDHLEDQQVDGRIVVPERVAIDVRTTVPPDSSFWSTTHGHVPEPDGLGESLRVSAARPVLLQARARVRHPHSPRRRLRPDRQGKRRPRQHGSQTLRFTVHNRQGWA